jgi:hypothetical protein
VNPSAGLALRVLRSLALAGTAVITGVLAHASAGGYLPGASALVALWLAASTAVAPLLGRQASAVRIVVLLMLGQTAIHGVLTALVGHHGDPASQWSTTAPPAVPLPPSAGAHRSGSFFDQLSAMQPRGNGTVTVPAWMLHLVADMSGPHALMALGHLAAAAVVGLWLAAGERALWTLLTVMSRPLVDGLVALLAVARMSGARGLMSFDVRLRRPRPAPWLELAPAWAALLPHSVVRRGPPAPASS